MSKLMRNRSLNGFSMINLFRDCKTHLENFGNEGIQAVIDQIAQETGKEVSIHAKGNIREIKLDGEWLVRGQSNLVDLLLSFCDEVIK